MMNGIAMGPLLVLMLIIGGGILLVALIGGRRRRKGGMVVASILLLLLVLGVSLLFTRTAQSRAVAEHDLAVAMRDRALHEEMTLRESMSASEPHDMDPGLAESDSDAEAIDSDEQYAEHAASTVVEIQRNTDQAIAAFDGDVEATRDSVVRNVQVKTRRPIPPVPPVPTKPKSSFRSLPDRSARAQIVTGILLAGVVLAGYFFLNANTRGHYTWRLRIGSTLVFVASLAVIMLISMH